MIFYCLGEFGGGLPFVPINLLSHFEVVAPQLKKKLDVHPSGLDFG